jgi:hypothetical protein
MFENIFHIPRKFKAIIISVFSLLIPISVFALGYVLLNKMGNEITIAAFSFMNLVITGSGIAILVLFTQRSKSTSVQLAELDSFLTKDIPRQIRNTQIALPNNVAHWRRNVKTDNYRRVQIDILHFRFVPKCWYYVKTSSFGEIAVYISATNYNIRTSFLVPKKEIDADSFNRTFEAFFENARSFGFHSGEMIDLPWTEMDKYFIVQLSYKSKENSTLDNVERLHVATIVSDLVRRFSLTCRKNGINLSYDRNDFF